MPSADRHASGVSWPLPRDGHDGFHGFPARRAACSSNLQVWGFISPILLVGIQRRHSARLAGVTGHSLSCPSHRKAASAETVAQVRATPGWRRACCCVWTNWTAGSVQLSAHLCHNMRHVRHESCLYRPAARPQRPMPLSTHARWLNSSCAGANRKSSSSPQAWPKPETDTAQFPDR